MPTKRLDKITQTRIISEIDLLLQGLDAVATPADGESEEELRCWYRRSVEALSREIDAESARGLEDLRDGWRRMCLDDEYSGGPPISQEVGACREFLSTLRATILERPESLRFELTKATLPKKIPKIPVGPGKIFIGHGRSSQWKELKDFISDRLKLEWDEFNREPPAGKTTIQRLQEMLNEASFAFIVLTAEDESADGTMRARENVVHELGLFQGRLNFETAIVLLEDGCSEFSNIHGLTQIRFPKGNIGARFEEIRRVLEREGIL